MPLAVGPTSAMSDPDEDLRARVHDEDVLGVARTGLLQRCTEKKEDEKEDEKVSLHVASPSAYAAVSSPDALHVYAVMRARPCSMPPAEDTTSGIMCAMRDGEEGEGSHALTFLCATTQLARSTR